MQMTGQEPFDILFRRFSLYEGISADDRARAVDILFRRPDANEGFAQDEWMSRRLFRSGPCLMSEPFIVTMQGSR